MFERDDAVGAGPVVGKRLLAPGLAQLLRQQARRHVGRTARRIRHHDADRFIIALQSHRMQGDFDFIVVGAGTAGCVVASRLAASGEHRVLLLEAGGEDSSPWIHVPLGYAKLIADARYNWMYTTAPEPQLNDRVLDQPCGRVIGGSGSLNAMLHLVGQPADYEGWRALGNEGWGWKDVQPWF